MGSDEKASGGPLKEVTMQSRENLEDSTAVSGCGMEDGDAGLKTVMEDTGKSVEVSGEEDSESVSSKGWVKLDADPSIRKRVGRGEGGVE